MSIRLCIGEYAKNGYEPIHMGTTIFSVEELCFFIRENACLLDESFMEEELMVWLEKECGLPGLAQELRGVSRKKSSLKGFVDVILEYTGFFSPEENRQIIQIITENSSLSVYEKRKARADAFLAKENFALAGREYWGLLKQLGPEEKQLKGQVYHGCGVCLARLFYFTLAGEYFQRAYELTGRRESFKQYLWTKRLAATEGEYLNFLKNHEEAYEDSLEMEEELEKLREGWQDSPRAELLASVRREEGLAYEQKLKERVEYLKDAYCSMLNGSR